MIVELADRQRAKQYKDQTAKELGIDIEKLQALIAKSSHASRYERIATVGIHNIFMSAYLLAYGGANKQEEAVKLYESVLSFLESMTYEHNIDIEEAATMAEDRANWSVHQEAFEKRRRKMIRAGRKGNGKLQQEQGS